MVIPLAAKSFRMKRNAYINRYPAATSSVERDAEYVRFGGVSGDHYFVSYRIISTGI